MTYLLDEGLQPERTSLAWRRTCLAVVTGALVGARLLPEVLGTAGLAVALVALFGAAALASLAERRSRRVSRVFRQGEPPPGAGVLALFAAAVSGASTIALVAVLLHALR